MWISDKLTFPNSDFAQLKWSELKLNRNSRALLEFVYYVWFSYRIELVGVLRKPEIFTTNVVKFNPHKIGFLEFVRFDNRLSHAMKDIRGGKYELFMYNDIPAWIFWWGQVADFIK